jgi:hypothetical protein
VIVANQAALRSSPPKCTSSSISAAVRSGTRSTRRRTNATTAQARQVVASVASGMIGDACLHRTTAASTRIAAAAAGAIRHNSRLVSLPRRVRATAATAVITRSSVRFRQSPQGLYCSLRESKYMACSGSQGTSPIGTIHCRTASGLKAPREGAKKRRIEGRTENHRVAPSAPAGQLTAASAPRASRVRESGHRPAARTLTDSFGSSNLRIFDVYRRCVQLFA